MAMTTSNSRRVNARRWLTLGLLSRGTAAAVGRITNQRIVIRRAGAPGKSALGNKAMRVRL
jgi:hypothetical protein